MLLDRLRVPRLLLDVPALQPLQLCLHELRQRYLPRPDEAVPQPDKSVPHPIAQPRGDDPLSLAWEQVAMAPADLEAWLNLGRAEETAQSTAAASGIEEDGAGARRPAALPPTEEDCELLDMLEHPTRHELPEASFSDHKALPALKQIAKALLAENLALAHRLEPLRHQLGYRVDALETWIKYEHTKYYMRALALYMHRYGVLRDLPAAPSAIPPSLRTGFAMGGVAQIQSGYLNATYPESYQDIYTDFDLETFETAWHHGPIAPGEEPPYPPDFILALGKVDFALKEAVRTRVSRDASVAVIGSRGPVYEALCLACGARPTTIRRTAVINRAKALTTTTFALWEANPRPFDAAIAVCVVEQAGLGMHGEPLDPEADLELMRLLKRMVKPNGLLFLVVPIGVDCTVFNATRVYGPLRLPRVLTGWTVIERQQHQDPMIHGRGENQSLFVLTNTG